MTQARKTAEIDLFADLTCPWCYVGWAALKVAAAQSPDVACVVRWRSFLLNPDAPREGVDRKAYFAKLFAEAPERAEAARSALNAAATAVGAPLNLDAATRVPNTIDAHRVIHWASGQGRAEAMTDALFAAYFVEGHDIGEADVLAGLASEVGLEGELVGSLLASDADRPVIASMHEAAARIGVRGVPVVVINQQAVLMGAEPPETYRRAIEAAARLS